MTSRLVEEALVRTMSDHRWTVTCAEYPYGLVRLERRSRLTRVVVGDRAAPGDKAVDVSSYVAVACTSDGELLVAVRSAPPAIVVGPDSCRMEPSGGAPHGRATLNRGERLVLLSCAAFEAVPDVLVDGVSGTSSSRLASQDPESLLVALLRGAARGAGAIIEHHPIPEGAPS